MVEVLETNNENNLPWWTWVLPLPIFHIGSQISVQFIYTQGVAAIYLPTALGIILVNWWGWKRVIPSLYINALLSTPLWGVTEWYFWPLLSLPEAVGIFLSWFLFTNLFEGKYWLPNNRELIKFILFAILVPFLVELVLLQTSLVIASKQPMALFWSQFLRNLLSELTSSFSLCAVILYFFSGFMQRKGWLQNPTRLQLAHSTLFQLTKKKELVVAMTILIAISLVVPFYKYWFLYGIFSLYVAVRFGFGETLLCNFFLLLITYIIPASSGKMDEMLGEDSFFNIFLGNLFLYVFAAITGRTISDLRSVEMTLSVQNRELKNTNSELDRFVYSVSHDLSAPLKSIQGLVNISKLDSSVANKEDYLNKIGKSVAKLDLFIKEILDYSRNNRIAVGKEQIALKELTTDVIDSLMFMDNFQKTRFDISGLEGKTVVTDRLRLRIIVNNLLSNAIKFQKMYDNEVPLVQVSCHEGIDAVKLMIQDNGEGIHPHIIPKIFDMFFRGHIDSRGSGLGLYIAREAAEKLNGKINVSTEYGKGTTFTVEIPLHV